MCRKIVNRYSVSVQVRRITSYTETAGSAPLVLYCIKCGDVYPAGVRLCPWDQTPLAAWQLPATSVRPEISDAATTVASDPATVPDSAIERTTVDPTVLAVDAALPFHREFRVVTYDEESPAPLMLSGRRLADRYRLERQIGVGGYGVVYSAIDEQLDEAVAVKILSPAVAEHPSVLARFRREALAANRIRHHGIIRIFDFGTELDGTSYIVMEHLDGIDLADALKANHRLSPAHALSIVAQCAQALAAAHREGILHRDLKPANVFLLDGDRFPRVRIIDFGIAKDLQAHQDRDLTSVSKVVGTPYYMAPEQAKGADIDGRADLYALGVILFEMLTGTKPFQGESSLEILMAHVEGERVPPSRFVPDLAAIPGLDDMVLRALARRPHERYDDMTSFGHALMECLKAAQPEMATTLHAVAERRTTRQLHARSQELTPYDSTLPPLPAPQAADPSWRSWPVAVVVALVTIAGIAAASRSEEQKARAAGLPVQAAVKMQKNAMADAVVEADANRRPTTNHRPPTTDNRRPTTDDRRPTTDDRRPTTDDRRPTTEDRRPTTDDRRPTTEGPQPTTDNRAALTRENEPNPARAADPIAQDRSRSSKQTRTTAKRPARKAPPRRGVSNPHGGNRAANRGADKPPGIREW